MIWQLLCWSVDLKCQSSVLHNKLCMLDTAGSCAQTNIQTATVRSTLTALFADLAGHDMHRPACISSMADNTCCAVFWLQRRTPDNPHLQGIRASKDGTVVPFDSPPHLPLLTSLPPGTIFGLSRPKGHLHTSLPVVAAYGRDVLLQDNKHALLSGLQWTQVWLHPIILRPGSHDAHPQGGFQQ